MTVNDSLMSDNSGNYTNYSNSPTILASEPSDIGTHNNPMHRFSRGMNFTANPLYQHNRQRYLNNQAALSHQPQQQQPQSRRVKRRNSEASEHFKKIKQTSGSYNQTPIDQLTLDNIDLSEYPKFNHPEGGIIQFTPIGNIRTFISDNNIVNRVIEQNSTFDLNQTEKGIDGYKLYFEHVQMNTSPSNEIEGYMRTGYSNPITSNSYYSNAPSSYPNNFDYDCDSDLEEDDYMN